MKTTALFVMKDSIYRSLGCDCFDLERDAFTYHGDNPVVAHPPCQLWGKFAKVNFKRWGGEHNRPGNDGGAFKFALDAVNRCGGVLEHPAQTYAWAAHGLEKPQATGWKRSGNGWVCEVWQSAYGHKARKRTWIYYAGELHPIDPSWDHPSGTHQIGFQDQRGKHRNKPTLSRHDANATPVKFAKYLVKLAKPPDASLTSDGNNPKGVVLSVRRALGSHLQPVGRGLDLHVARILRVRIGIRLVQRLQVHPKPHDGLGDLGVGKAAFPRFPRGFLHPLQDRVQILPQPLGLHHRVNHVHLFQVFMVLDGHGTRQPPGVRLHSLLRVSHKLAPPRQRIPVERLPAHGIAVGLVNHLAHPFLLGDGPGSGPVRFKRQHGNGRLRLRRLLRWKIGIVGHCSVIHFVE